MAPIPDYPGIKPTKVSTYNLDFGEGHIPAYDEPVIPIPSPGIRVPVLARAGQKKMKDNKALRDEVRGAVNEYLTSLINQRSNKGQGHSMAVNAQDLMVASRSSGHHASRAEADKILEQFTKPPATIIIRPTTASSNGTQKTRGSVAPAGARAKSATGAPIGPNGTTKKKDYHWLVWKTTPTPVVPNTPIIADACGPAIKTPAPPPSPAVRPPSSRARSVTSRMDTPKTPAPEVYHPTCPTPDPFRTPTGPPITIPTGAGRIATPAPPTPAPAHRIATPASMQADHHDNLSSPQMYPKYIADGNHQDGPQFVPALNAWVANATDQEKDVALNFMKAMNAGMNPLKIPKIKSKPKAKTPQPPSRPASVAASGSGFMRAPPGGPTQLYRMPAAGVRTSAPVNKPYLDKDIEEQYCKMVAKSLQTVDPTEWQYTGQNTTNRPWPTHLPRAAQPIDYTHEASFFQLTKRPKRRDFVIRPDWISEGLRPPTATSTTGGSYRKQYCNTAPSRDKVQNSMPQYRSHFIVHPEWVSETTAGQRNLKLLTCTKGPQAIRYMAQKN